MRCMLYILCRFDQFCRYFTQHHNHHCQMLEIIVCLEQGITRQKLDQDAANGPNITRIGPAHAQYNFWSSIVPCGYHIRMVVLFKCRRPEINEADVCIGQDSRVWIHTVHLNCVSPWSLWHCNVNNIHCLLLRLCCPPEGCFQALDQCGSTLVHVRLNQVLIVCMSR